MKRALLVLAVAVSLTAWAAVQYAAYQRLITEQQTAQEHVWGDKAPRTVSVPP